ncbi:glucokinase [Agrobacterium tumefaciens]|uniref:Glucokinase n=2 Tax=Rhizobium rhizogenes TaxID=359 RepID=A0AA92BZP1_RHIRH|nr:glucokinase [Rhizobium rhizogenes]PVE62391.1 glucokinase [Agrobacterium tumefaciens]PVE70574.1 glucokinase [Sphingomonas sp. TPD3009]
MSRNLAIGFDLGGTQVRAALVDGGEVLARASAPTDVAGPLAVMEQFRTLAAEVRAGFASERVSAVGVSAPGPLDTVSGVVDHIPTLPGWDQFPLRAALEDVFGLPVAVENDGIAAAYGEWKHGAGRGLDNLVYATVSTGLGGGAVVDGRLMHGRRGMGAHIGHFRIVPDGPLCSCGAPGCFEAMAAGTALGKRAKQIAALNPEGYLGRKRAAGEVLSKDAVDGARLRDPECVELIREEAEYLGVGFTGLIHIFSPDIVVMGGGVSKAFDLLDDGMHAVIRRDAMAPFKEVRVVPAELGDNAGLVGAAALALSLVNQNAATGD